MLKRGSGILLHISSLPSRYGIGDLGAAAYNFVDILNGAGQHYWQMLPLNPTDGVYGESPYSSPSVFACNTLFISPDRLYEAGWLSKEDLVLEKDFPDDRVDFSSVRAYKERLFRIAFENFKQTKKSEPGFIEFCWQEKFWLDDHAMFMVLKEMHSGKRWNEWSEEMRMRKPAAMKEFKKKHAREIEYMKFLQFLFWRQWKALCVYCQELKVKLIGDIPIYVNEDSADVWANPGLFKLDGQLRAQCVAGVPPDYFSETGQRWGNPVYDWERMQANGYAWWMKRLERQFELFDIVRIDHFRGFEAYWEIPASEETAVNGQWVDGPKDAFFQIVQDRFHDLPIIGEDLGLITEEVTALMKRFQIPGMKVLQFAFGGELETHPYIPENYVKNCIAYTGTHDNNTTRGWFANDLSDVETTNLKTYLKKDVREEEIAWDFIELALSSKASIAVIPLQDVLNFGQESRINTPGTAQNNWRWRCQDGQIQPDIIGRLRALTERTGRMR